MIRRSLYGDIRAHLAQQEITVLTGPRQAGKTTLLKLLIDELQVTGFRCAYLNLDRESDFALLDTQDEFLNYLKLNFGTDKKTYVFIDEIQRKTNAGLFLKGLYDSDLPYKFIVSGSGSVELKEKVSEGLAGRKKTFHLSTVTFDEFVNYRTNYKYDNQLQDYFKSSFFDVSFLEEYLQFGGYPKLVEAETVVAKRDVLDSVYESYVASDLKDLLGVQNAGAIRDLLTFLSTRMGKMTARSEISSKIATSYETTKQYLYYLEQTFQINVTKPYSTNFESELSKTPVYYFSDLGMRNYVFNNLSHYDQIVSGSMLFQNLVFLLLKQKQFISKINYWRTKDRAEVDFIVHQGATTLPLEVKYADLKDTHISRSMHSFIDKYSPKQMLVINKSLSSDRKVANTWVRFVPYHWLVSNEILEKLW